MFNVVIEKSLKDVTKKEMLQLKDLADAVRLDQETQEHGSVMIYNIQNMVKMFLVSDDPKNPKEYAKTVITDTEGNRFVTGSESFARRAWEIADDMAGEEFGLKVYRRPSKNYPGRDFLSCSVI
jgi:hypothetical protein